MHPPPTPPKKCVCVWGGGGGGKQIVLGTDPVGVGVSVKLLTSAWNILMVLHRNVDQDEMTCCIQYWQLWLSYFWTSSVTQVWSITLHFIHHPWDNWLTKRRFLWIFITPGNTSIANQNVVNIALLSSVEDSFVLLPLLKIIQENPINVFVSN